MEGAGGGAIRLTISNIHILYCFSFLSWFGCFCTLFLIFECAAAIDMNACYDGIHADGGYGVKVISSSMPGDGAGGSVSFILPYFAFISLI